MTNITLKIDRILVDPALQPRIGGLDTDHVAALQENPQAWPSLAVVERGGYVLVDGFHRYAAAQNLSLKTIPVVVHELLADADLRALAFALNAVHGRPLTLADRRAEAERLLKADTAVSNLEVARRTALSPTTVAGLREQLEAQATIPVTEQRVSRSGVAYTPSSVRPRGELPAEQESLVDRLFTAKERREQRRLAHYLARLAVALDDGEGFESWETASGAADACRAVFGDKDAAELAERLAIGSRNVLGVAEELGYEATEA
ncbi:MAG: ParB/RepB/Spo0J family partition protein [Thermoleophilia bacterium]